jgi:hypothetical protein
LRASPFSRDICASAHGDAYGRFHQSGSIIDPVAHHDDGMSLLRKPSDEFQFVLGQQFGSDLIDAQLSTDVLRYGLRISGEKDRLQSHRFEILYRLGSFRSEHIGNDKSSGCSQ